MPTIADQRMQALQKAVAQKQKFDSLDELRKIKSMVILSHLLEFDCATAQNLLRLLDQKNNAILTRMVKDKLIKIMRWQNAQVYIPTAKGKQWLLENLDDDKEIERVRNTPIKRKISGYSHEHDLLLQNAAIEWATCEAEENESWRLFKPRKTQQSGKVPDAIAVFEKDNKTRRVIIELERTKKTEVELLCALSRLVDSMIDNQYFAIILTPNKRIYDDYMAAIWAMMDADDGGLSLTMPECEMLPGLIPRPALSMALSQGALYDSMRQTAISRIDINLIDADGSGIMPIDDFEALLFNPIIWQIAMRQQNPGWENVIMRAARRLYENAHLADRDNCLRTDLFGTTTSSGEPEAKTGEREISALALGKSLRSAFQGPDGAGNPMRSRGDLEAAWKRWRPA